MLGAHGSDTDLVAENDDDDDDDDDRAWARMSPSEYMVY